MSSQKRVMHTKDSMMALEKSEKIKDLQRTLRIKSAFQKMKAEKRILESLQSDKKKTKNSNIQPEDNFDPELFESGFTRYDIVELNSDGETMQESVIVQHPADEDPADNRDSLKEEKKKKKDPVKIEQPETSSKYTVRLLKIQKILIKILNTF